MITNPRLSVVVPLFNEEENVAPLVRAVREALEGHDWELLLVDDGSRDDTVARAVEESGKDNRVRVLRLARNYGQTVAMQAGFDHARGERVVSMDGDLQNDPADIPRLLSQLEDGFDLVAGYRVDRKDNWLTRKLPSWLANRLIARITGVSIRDNGCSLKAYRRSLLEKIHLYSELHRFIPAVAAGTTGARIAEIPVRHHPRRRGTSKYGLSRTWRVLTDLLTVVMIRWFRERPLMLFGWGSLLAALVGFGLLGAAVVSALYFTPYKANALVFPGAAVITLGLSFYLLMLGLVGEVAIYGNQQRTESFGLQRGESL